MRADLDRLRRLTRKRSEREADGTFVIEGPRAVVTAIEAGAVLETVFVDGPTWTGAVRRAMSAAEAAGVPVRELPVGSLRRVTDAATPQAVVAIARRTAIPLSEAARSDLVLVLVAVNDPGNAGTLVRTAEAAGAGSVVFSDGSVDPFHPKVVRSTAGALFGVGLVSGGDPVSVLEQLAATHQRLATRAEGAAAYDTVDLTGPVALVFGNEAHGLPPEVAGAVDREVTIPMAGRIESLNVAMAGAVLCFEVLRQRRGASTQP